MKIQFNIQDSTADVRIRGELLGDACNCLEHFWDRHLDKQTRALHLDLSDVTRLDAAGRELVLHLLQRQARSGTRITLHTHSDELRSRFERIRTEAARAVGGGD